MKIKVMLLGISIICGANFAANSALDTCTLWCIDERIACMEAGMDSATCYNEYRACRADCSRN